MRSNITSMVGIIISRMATSISIIIVISYRRIIIVVDVINVDMFMTDMNLTIITICIARVHSIGCMSSRGRGSTRSVSVSDSCSMMVVGRCKT